MRNRALRVVIVDDHTLVREGLVKLLIDDLSVQVVGHGGSGKSAIALVRKHKPDLLLVELMLPDMDGMEVLRRVCDSTKVLVLSLRNEPWLAAEALRNGASGYVAKEESLRELSKAMNAVMRGRKYVSRRLGGGVARDIPRNRNGAVTRREWEVLQLAAKGTSNVGIARRLGLSERTVEMHRTRLRRKLNLRTQTDLVRYAIRQRLLAA